MRPGRSIGSLVCGLLLAVTLVISTAPTAHASPTTDERRRVAEDVAASICKAVPRITKLPATVNANELCRSVIVENVDPEGNNSGVRAACEAALPAPARAVTKYCAQALDTLLDPARTLFLDKVVPAAEQLSCIATSPAAFDCLAQQVHVWLKQSIIGLWQGLITSLTTDTSAIALIAGWPNRGVVSLYSDVGAIGATLLLGLMLTSLVISAIRFDFRQFGSTLLGVVVWGTFWSAGATIAVLLLRVSDDAARWLGGRPDEKGVTDIARAGREFGNWVDYISGASASAIVRPLYNPGSLTGVLVCLLLIVAIVVTLIALLMRNVALLLIIVSLPLTLAGTAGPRTTRGWFVSSLRMFVALLIAKPLIVIAIRLGSVMVSVPAEGEPRATFSDAMLGVTIILLAGLLPGIIYRFSGGLMSTAAGAGPRASSGVSGQSAQAALSSMDMTRMVMERNAPRPALAGAASTTGVQSGRASALAGATGPLGLAAMGVAVAGGALESGGRWLAANAATGGGVLGDVEAPHVPGPPVSRLPYRGSSSAATPGTHTRTDGRAQQQPTTITVVQTSAPAPTRTPLPPSGSHLVIPGTVVDEPAERSPAQAQLPPGTDHE